VTICEVNGSIAENGLVNEFVITRQSPLQKPFLNTKDTKATKEIQGRFKNIEP
jgi:hypothetical protein